MAYLHFLFFGKNFVSSFKRVYPLSWNFILYTSKMYFSFHPLFVLCIFAINVPRGTLMVFPLKTEAPLPLLLIDSYSLILRESFMEKRFLADFYVWQIEIYLYRDSSGLCLFVFSILSTCGVALLLFVPA